MSHLSSVLVAYLASILTWAIVAQPALALEATTTLPLGDINVVILTDVHSWIGGHGEKQDLDADYGDVLSFYQRLQDQVAVLNVQNHKHDLWFVMNGDWIDGTGLALNGDTSYLIPLLEKMPWDAINVGNHELYKHSVIESMTRPGGFIEWWGPRYLSSNVLKSPESVEQLPELIGNPYRLLRGQYSTVLAFGFLYNMQGQGNDASVQIQRVQDAVREEWFEEALTAGALNPNDKYDAILVLAHMDFQDELVDVILDRIRHFVDDDMPVQFVTGHSHIRGFEKPDNFSLSFEAGKYLDTIGFVSLPTQTTIREAAAAKAEAAEQTSVTTFPTTTNPTVTTIEENPGSLRKLAENSTALWDHRDEFRHMYIDGKYDSLADALGITRMQLVTEDGIELTNFINKVKQEIGLNRIVGCINEDYMLEKSLEEDGSLYGLFCNQVIPHVFPFHEPETGGNPIVFMVSKDSFRYSLFAKELILDEVIAVSPFNDTLFQLSNIPGYIMDALNSTMNDHDSSTVLPALPEWITCPSPATGRPQPGSVGGQDLLYDLVTADFQVDEIVKGLSAIWPSNYSNPKVGPQPPKPVKISHTSLSVWLEFFDGTNLCKTENKGTQKPIPPKPNHPNTHNKNNNGKSNHPQNGNHKEPEGEGSIFTNEPETPLDKFRMLFYAASILFVSFLLSVYVKQRGRIHRTEVMAREMATQEALDEFNEQHGIGPARYRDDFDQHESFDEGTPDEEEQFEDEGHVELSLQNDNDDLFSNPFSIDDEDEDDENTGEGSSPTQGALIPELL